MVDKICTKCEQDLPLSSFGKRAHGKGGLSSICIVCVRARHSAYYLATREKFADQRRARRLKYYLAYKAQAVAKSRKYRARNPEAVLLSALKGRAKKMGRSFSLTMQDIIIPETCPVLGIPLSQHAGKRDGPGGLDNSASVDRIDSDKGYTPDNIIIVSNRVNRLKNNATPDELMKVALFYRVLAESRERDQVEVAAIFGAELGAVAAAAAIAAAEDLGYRFFRP